MSAHQDRLKDAFASGLRKGIRTFQERPFAFYTESSIQSMLYAHVRESLAGDGLLLAKGKPYSSFRDDLDIELIQSEQTLFYKQEQQRSDLLLVDPTPPVVLQPSRIRPLVVVELKADIREDRTWDPMCPGPFSPGKRPGEGNLLTDMAKCDWYRDVYRPVDCLVLFFTSVTGEIDAGILREHRLSRASAPLETIGTEGTFIVGPGLITRIDKGQDPG